MHRRQTLAASIALAGLLAAAAAQATTWQTTVSCGFNGAAGDGTDRGLYVTNYSGNNLGPVELAFAGGTAFWSITLTAHRNGFNGPQIGVPQTATLGLIGADNYVVFDFGGAPVTPGDTIAFTVTAQQITGAPASLSFDTGTGTCPGVFETNGTSGTLDTTRRNTMGLLIREEVISTTCVPSDTVLCLDDTPGDHRFKVTATYHTSQAGGLSGPGQAIPLSQLGVSRGGVLWFFSPDNPEVLIKIVNGCTINNHYWAYLSAGTNVGFTITVRDEVTGHVFVYTNPDLTAAPAVQNASSLACS